ncbi:MAG: glycosyltransferase family 39 protein [Candidatus Omnitrophica bacterium]|nr:glycosyltransferase family 39 protein [Candidatus Omnitrophota bacterium]
MGRDFYKYQIVSTFLNSTLLLSIYLFCKEYFKIENKNLFIFLCFILFFNPYILRQITYPWTKAFSGYYTICGLYFYIKFLKDNKNLFLIISGILFGCAFLVHYSSGLYILPLIIYIFLKRSLFKKLLIFNIIFFLIIFTYFSWSIKNYGIKNTFLSNTSYQQKNLSLNERIEKDLNNLFKTIFPIIPKEFTNIFKFYKDSKFRFFNYILPFYSSNIFGNLTISLSIFLLFIVFKKIKNLNIEKFFIYFFLFCFFLGIIVNPSKDLVGVAHVTFLPFVSLILSFLIKEIINYEKRKILLIFFTFETLSFFVFQIYIFKNYFVYEKIVYLYNTSCLDSYHFGNFLLKYKNGLIFLFDKFYFR